MVIDFKRLTWLPSIIIILLTLHMCLSLADLEMATLSYGLHGLFLLSFAFIFFLFLRKGETSHFVFIGIIYQLFLLAITIINNADIKNCIYFGCEAILILTVMEYYKERLNMILFAFAAGFTICVFLGLLHMLSNPQLWFIEDEKKNVGYLLGNNYNQMGCRLLCAVTINMLCTRINKWWYIISIPVVITSISILTIIRSMTSFTCIVLFLLFILIPSKKIQKSGVISLFFVVLLFQTFVCFNGKGIENNDFAVYFVEDILKKDITFSNRTEMWDSAAKTFAESPIWGHGYVSGEWYLSHMNASATGPHNQLLSVLIYGGLILLFLFFFFFFTATKTVFFKTDRTGNLILSALACFSLMMTMEVYPLSFLVLLLSIAYYRNYIKIARQ